MSDSGIGGANSAETAYLELEIAVGDALFMDILQTCDVRVGSKDPKVLGRTERAEHIWRVICCPMDSDNVVSEDKVQEVTTIYIFQHQV